MLKIELYERDYHRYENQENFLFRVESSINRIKNSNDIKDLKLNWLYTSDKRQVRGCLVTYEIVRR